MKTENHINKSLDFWNHVSSSLVPFDNPIFETVEATTASAASCAKTCIGLKKDVLTYPSIKTPNIFIDSNFNQYHLKNASVVLLDLKYNFQDVKNKCECVSCCILEEVFSKAYKRLFKKEHWDCVSIIKNEKVKSENIMNPKIITSKHITRKEDMCLNGCLKMFPFKRKKPLEPKLSIWKIEETIQFAANLGLKPVWKSSLDSKKRKVKLKNKKK